MNVEMRRGCVAVLGVVALLAVNARAQPFSARPTGQPTPGGSALCVGYGEAAAWYESAPGLVKVCAPEGTTVSVEFKGPDGEHLGGISGVSGGCISVPAPECAKSYDWSNGPTESTESDAEGVTAAPESGPGSESEGQAWLIGCTTLYVHAGETGLVWLMRVVAETAAAAQLAGAPIVQEGAGCAVPQGVVVGLWAELEAEADTVTVRSSLPESFARYELWLDGALVADLASGKNAVPAHAGNGWTTITSVLPGGLAEQGHTLVLAQRGQGEVQGAEVVLEL
jgi:hypothetical protein